MRKKKPTTYPANKATVYTVVRKQLEQHYHMNCLREAKKFKTFSKGCSVQRLPRLDLSQNDFINYRKQKKRHISGEISYSELFK